MPKFHPSFLCRNSTWIRGGFLGAVLAIIPPRMVRAADSLSYKFQSWQEDGQRIRVASHYLQAEQNLGSSTQVKLMGLIDSIAGATPTGEMPAVPKGAVPLALMKEVRHAWEVGISHQIRQVKVAVGYALSRESDYVSEGCSINTVTDFNQKNTTLTVGYGRTNDRLMEPKLGWQADRFKTGNDFIVGVGQLLGPNTSLTGNVSYGKSRGFLSDPYKIVSTRMLDLDPGFYYTPPENRPREKNKVSVFLGVNRNYERFHGALDASYRYYHDTFGIFSHTVALTWLQDMGAHLVIQPSIRIYRQSAADFYYYDLDRAKVITTFDPSFETGTGRAPFYSSDYRLSSMQTVDVGLKLVWKFKSWATIDLAYDRYLSRGLDGVTSRDAYSKANAFTIGLNLFR